jgi:TatD DNase family protein
MQVTFLPPPEFIARQPKLPEQTISELRRLASNNSVVAIGECGLDFNRDFSPRPQQEEWFEGQVALAEELQMPLFLHERDAQQRFCEILARVRMRVPDVVHCFTGTQEELRVYLDMGLHIGIIGWICDERRGIHLRELVKEISPDRLMIETDAPYDDLKWLGKATVADCLGKAADEVAEMTAFFSSQAAF